MGTRKAIDQQLVRDLAELLNETGLTEIEIEQSGLRLRVQRAATTVATVEASAPVPVATKPLPRADAEPATPPEPAAHPGTVTSPMVGTVYRSPEPGAPPFVEVGTVVSEGDSLMIVEAMKTFNPIPAPRGGTVKAILVDDGQPVEFGEPLAIIE